MPVVTRSQTKKMETLENMTHPQLVRMAVTEKLLEEALEMLKERNSELAHERIMSSYHEQQCDKLNEEKRQMKNLLKYAYQQIGSLTDKQHALKEENKSLNDDILEMGAEINNRCAGELMFHQTPDGDNCLIEIHNP